VVHLFFHSEGDVDGGKRYEAICNGSISLERVSHMELMFRSKQLWSALFVSAFVSCSLPPVFARHCHGFDVGLGSGSDRGNRSRR